MKRKLLLAALCVVSALGFKANAQGWTASAPTTGDFYLYNVGANAYLENGSSWGTHAALKSSGFVVNVTAGDGVYTIGTNSKYTDKFFTDNGYVDTPNSTNWTLEAVPGLTNTYYLKTAAGHFAYAAAGMYNVEIGADPGTNKAYWKFVTADNRNDVSGASATNPIELTHKINNPRFDDDNSGWQNPPARGGNTSGTNNDVPTWDNFNPCAEHYNTTYDTYQELTGLSNGVYAVSMQGFYREGGYVDAASKHNAGTESLNAILYANSAEQPLMSIFEEAGKASGGATVTTEGISGAFPNMRDAASYFFSAGLYWNTVYVEVTDGTLKFGVKKSTAVGDDWTVVDNFRLQYFGSCTIEEAKLGPSISALAAAVLEAQAYIDASPALSTTQITALQNIVNDNDNDNHAFTTKEEFDTAISNIATALVAYKAMVAPYAKFNALKASANAIADVEYTETTSGSHTTFTTAITTQTSAADNAATVDAINAATTALTAAIKTYIAGAEPMNDGEYFDITCLMTNPNFEDSYNGWTYLAAPGVSWSNCEYYQSEFDINQTVTDLPTGSYSLSVQAFQRPGWAGEVYDAYIGGTDNASSVLYINSITSNVKNIAADAQSTYLLGDGSSFEWPNDSRVGAEGSYKYIPNSQQGSKLWFDAGFYNATCAAVVTAEDGGSLKLGFKSTKTHVDRDWTIFDNFRLYYYGSSLLVYYKQYLPQLKSEAGADLSNALYNNVTGKEKSDFQTALDATPASETEEAYKAVIDNITEKQAAFRTAVTAYDALVAAKAYAALTEITANIGSGVFQYPTNTTDKWTTYSDAKSAVDGYTVISSSTASAVQALVDALDNAIADYNGITLNAPAADKRYYLNIIDDGQDWDGYAITFVAGGRDGEGNYNVQYLATANPNLCQAIKFTAVEGSADTYIISAVRADGGEQYLTTKLLAYEEGSNAQLRTTDDVAKAVSVKIQATTTDGQFKLLNVSADNAVIARNATNPDNGVYTNGDASFTIAEATEASVPGTIAAGKYATRIFPFTPSLPTGVKAYSCANVDGETLTLVEVLTPAANVPYILENTTEEEADIAQSGYGVATTTSYTAGLLTGTYTETPITADDNNYVLQTLNDKQAFYYVKEDFSNQPYRVYLSLNAQGGSAKPRTLYFNVDATGIAAISALTSDEVKAIYTTGGVKAQGLQKGLNIVQMKNGETKKIFVK